MAVLSKNYWKNRQFVYTTDLQRIETRAQDDFDMLASLTAGAHQRIAYGFNVGGVVSQPVSTIAANPYNAVAVAGGAGRLYASRVIDPEPASTFTGSFTPNATNYVNLVISEADSTSTAAYDIKTTTGDKVMVNAPDGVVMSHSYEVSTTAGTLPLAAVATNATNHIVSIIDVRPMLFSARPDSPAVTSDTFQALPIDDGSIGSIEDAVRALMTKAWMQGGQYWYSPSVDSHGMLVVGDWVTSTIGATDVSWTFLRVMFDNADSWYNAVAIPGSPFDLTADGQCLYVDLNRGSNVTLTAHVGTLAALGQPAPNNATSSGPGDRIVLVWRANGKNYVRGMTTPLGTATNIATNIAYGIVKLNNPLIGSGTIVSVVDDDTGHTGIYRSVIARGLSRGYSSSSGEGAPNYLYVGNGANDSGVLIGGDGKNIYVDGTAADNFTVKSDGTKTSGNVGVFKNANTTVATVPFNGEPTVSTDVLTRGFIGWGELIFSDMPFAATAFYAGPASSATADYTTISIIG